jgi:hypothetical protein
MKSNRIVPIRRVKILTEVGGVIDESGVTLAVYGDDLIPKDVTELLGVKPTRSFLPGYRRNPSSRPMPHGAWFLEVRGKTPDGPEAQLRKLLMKLPTSENVWKTLKARYKVQIRFGLHMTGWNKGFELSSTLIRRLAKIGVDLEFDVYAYGEDVDDRGK